MKATLNNIKIGTKVLTGKNIITIVEDSKKYFKGYFIYKGIKRNVLLNKKNFSNPHYMNTYFIAK
tara:strand:- start:38 stop:232 length:195 start_codon:yes stop_codon:yes gene_type:complete